MEDKEILDLYFRRDEDAIVRTKEAHGDFCCRIASNILPTHEDVEECVSDTWLRAWNAIPPARPDPMRPFLGRITRNLALSRWRKNRAAKRGGSETTICFDELADCLPGGAEPEHVIEAKALEETVNAFLGALKPGERSVFLARYWYFAPVREIAARTGKTESAVKSSLLRTRRKLYDYLNGEGLL